MCQRQENLNHHLWDQIQAGPTRSRLSPKHGGNANCIPAIFRFDMIEAEILATALLSAMLKDTQLLGIANIVWSARSRSFLFRR